MNPILHEKFHLICHKAPYSNFEDIVLNSSSHSFFQQDTLQETRYLLYEYEWQTSKDCSSRDYTYGFFFMLWHNLSNIAYFSIMHKKYKGCGANIVTVKIQLLNQTENDLTSMQWRDFLVFEKTLMRSSGLYKDLQHCRIFKLLLKLPHPF